MYRILEEYSENGDVLMRGAHWTYRVSTATVVAGHDSSVRVEVAVPRVARVASVERGRPVEAVVARQVELAAPAVAGCG